LAKRGNDVPRVKISVGDLKCINQADSLGKDDVYWVANLRSAPAVDQARTALTKITYDEDYLTSLPEMVRIGSGETKRFTNDVVYDEEVPANSYVFGSVHFMERDTALSNFAAKLFEAIAIVVIGLVLAAVIGFGIGYWIGGVGAAFGWAIIAVVAVGVIGFFVGAMIALVRPEESDIHLGGMRVVVGPLRVPPPSNDKDTWRLSLTPSGKLEVVDAHGAELVVYASSHTAHAVRTGHNYETALTLDITAGHR
jgi:hypothetical protein